MLLAADGLSNTAIAEKLGVSRRTVGLWRCRFAEKRVCGLDDEPRPGAPRRIALGAHQPEGTALRHPGSHRTDSVDYAVVVSGEIELWLDDEKDDVRLKAGDVVIQRGTNHAWVNSGAEPCRIAFVLIDAKPAV